jgi:ParB-like chromosome segregation protein Spo0J
MKVKMVPIGQVLPYDRNPRKRDQKDVDSLAAVIKECGWNQPIVVDKDFVIVAGHTRLAAAQKLGLAKVPVFIADHLTPAQAKAYRIADNRTGENTCWDPDLLKLELLDLSALAGTPAEAISISDPVLQLTGLDQAELIRTLEADKKILPPAEDPKPGKKSPGLAPIEEPEFRPSDQLEFGTHCMTVGYEHPEVVTKILRLLRKDFPKLEILLNNEPLEGET